MVVDIHGCIEVRSLGGWSAVIRLDDIYSGCDYDAFGCLFGVRNYAGFTPIAAGRGIPDDASRLTRQELEDWDDDVHWPSWIGYDEVLAIKGEELSRSVDERLHEFRRSSDGQMHFTGKGTGRPNGRRTAWGRVSEQGSQPWPEGAVWTRADGTELRAVRLRRREVLGGGEWNAVWSAMADRSHGADPADCRLVVWFDR